MVLSELSLFIPFQNIENKFLGLQYIGGPGDQASQGGPGAQVVRWSGGKSGQGGQPGWFAFRKKMVFIP